MLDSQTSQYLEISNLYILKHGPCNLTDSLGLFKLFEEVFGQRVVFQRIDLDLFLGVNQVYGLHCVYISFNTGFALERPD